MNCYKFYEGVYNKIENVLENPKPPPTYTDQTYYKSIYSPVPQPFKTWNLSFALGFHVNTHILLLNVALNQSKELQILSRVREKNCRRDSKRNQLTTLMNDWFEKRLGEQVEVKPDGPPLSENMDKYRPYCKSTFPDRKEYFNRVFDSYGLGQELLLDHLGQSYYDNYTTSYDLMYNHLKKGICGPFPRRYYKGSYYPATDLTQIFGNLTNWGLKEEVYRSMKSETCKEGRPVSETLAEFGKYDLQTVKKLNDFPKFNRVKAIY